MSCIIELDTDYSLGLYRGYVLGVYRGIQGYIGVYRRIMENQIETNVIHETEIGCIGVGCRGLYKSQYHSQVYLYTLSRHKMWNLGP